MKKTNKKGFTIVELVIVIAVIAILSAVLIPTFSSIIKNAKVNSDTQLVRNLNTALIADEAVNGKPATMYDALQIAEDAGYIVENINAKAEDNEILWNSKANVFCYLNDGVVEYIPDTDNGGASDSDLWIISDEISTKYSTYYTGDDTEVTVSTGFDAGENAGIKVNVDTDATITLTIRTSSVADIVYVDAPNATIHAYGEAGEYEVISVAGNSLHIYGKVEFLQITSGRVVAEKTAEINGLHVDSNDAKVVINAQANVETITKTEGVTANVTGYSEEITEADPETAKAGAKLFAAGNGSEALPFIIETVEQFKNIDKLYDKDTVQYFKLAANVTFAGETINISNAVIDLNNFTLTINDRAFYVAKSIEVKNGTIEYLNGVNLLYANQSETANVSLKFDALVLNGTVIVDQSHYGPLTSYMYEASYKGNYEIIANNVTTNMNITNIKSGDVGGLFGYIQGKKVAASVTNCTVNGTIQSQNVGGFFNTTSYPTARKIVNSGNVLNGSLFAAGGAARAFGLNSNYTPEGDTYTAQNDLVTVSAVAKLEVATSSTDLIKYSEDNQILINHTEATITKYIVELEYWVNRKSDGSGGYPRPITKTIEVSTIGNIETGLYKIDFDQVDSDANCPADAIIVHGAKIWKDGDSYKVYDPNYTLSGTKTYIRVYGYAGNKLINLQNTFYNIDLND